MQLELKKMNSIKMEMKSYKFKIALHLHYFDKGYGRLSIIKYFWLLAGGLFIQKGIDLKWSIYLGIIYMTVCYLFGWFWYKYEWNTAEIEVVNNINLFVKEMRKVFKQ